MPAGQSKYRRAVNTQEALSRRLAKDNKGNDTSGFASGKGNREASRKPSAEDWMRGVESLTVKRLPATLYKPKNRGQK